MGNAPAIVPPTQPLRFCTVATPSHLHQVTVLAASLVQHNPEAELTVLVLEEGAHAQDRGLLPFATLSLGDLEIPDLERRASRYTINELAMSLKARVIRAVLDRGPGPVCWLDGDCAVYGSLQAFGDQVAGASVTLTPHLLRPLPVGPDVPSEAAVVSSGSYNTGVVGVDGSAESRAFLDWWEGHLASEGLLRPEAGLFVDQRWADLVPSLFPRALICRDLTVNVAYWNLRERGFGARDGVFTVGDDEPLRIYHFSGFDPATPACPSRFVPSEIAPDGSPLHALLDGYARRLLASPQSDPAAPPFGTFPGGVRIDDRGRRLLCEAIDRGEVAVPVYEGPTGDAAREWLLAPATCPGGLSRWVEAFRAETDAVRDAFPDPVRDGRRLVAWLHRTGVERYGLDPQLLHGPALLAVTAPEVAPAVAVGPGDAAELAARLRSVLDTIPAAVPVVVAASAGAERDAARAVAADRELTFVDGGDAALARLVRATEPRDVAVVREGAVLSAGWLEGLWDTAHWGEVAAAVPVAVAGDITAGDAQGVATIARLGGTAARDIDTPCVYLRRDAVELIGSDDVPDAEWASRVTAAIHAAGLDVLLADDVLVGGRRLSNLTGAGHRSASVPRGFVLALAPAPPAPDDLAVERRLLAAALGGLLGEAFVDLAPGESVDPGVDVVLSVDPEFSLSPAHAVRVLWAPEGSAATGPPGERYDVLVAARVGARRPAGPIVLPGLGAADGPPEPASHGLLTLGGDGPRERFAAAVRALGPPGDVALLLGESGRTRAWALAAAGLPVLVAPDVAWRLGLGDDAVRLRSWRPGDAARQLGELAQAPGAQARNGEAWARLLSERSWPRAAGLIHGCCRDALAGSTTARS